MSARMSFVDRNSAFCPRCGQVTVHIRDICRTCDPCTATLLAAAEAVLSADQRPALAAVMAVHPEERMPAGELAA